MLEIAKQVAFNETVFILPSLSADYRLHYFTSGQEISLCGHATVAAIKWINKNIGHKNILFIETMIGTLKIISHLDGRIAMYQDQPKFLPYTGNKSVLAAALGVNAADFSETLPIIYGSTGTWTLLVPVLPSSITCIP